MKQHKAIVIGTFLGLVLIFSILAAYSIGYNKGLEYGRLATLHVLDKMVACSDWLKCLNAGNYANQTCITEWEKNDLQAYRRLMNI